MFLICKAFNILDQTKVVIDKEKNVTTFITSGPVENIEPMKVRAHVEACNIVVAHKHVLIRVARVQEDPHPGEQQLGCWKLVVPTQHAQIRYPHEGLGVFRYARVCRQ